MRMSTEQSACNLAVDSLLANRSLEVEDVANVRHCREELKRYMLSLLSPFLDEQVMRFNNGEPRADIFLTNIGNVKTRIVLADEDLVVIGEALAALENNSLLSFLAGTQRGGCVETLNIVNQVIHKINIVTNLEDSIIVERD